ncbi:unnamed protein product [Linum tenue]|uniref:Uncharacterized protein n=3 Tax=Linum tenue TaxID=586396 RepID=A0AAV0RXC5_9ROSI|nr:unnamed protein product [Linum tenue]
MESLERNSVADARSKRRVLRRLQANSRRKIYPSKNGNNGGSSSAKTRTRSRGNLPTKSTTNDHHYPPDHDYATFLDALGLRLPTAANSADGVSANRAPDSEAAIGCVDSGLKEDIDIDLFRLLAEIGGGSSIRTEDNGVGNNEDPGANSGCDMSMDRRNDAAGYADDSFLGACCSNDKNGLSRKDDTGAETTDTGFDDKSVDSFHVDSEFVEEPDDIGGSANDDNVVDRSFDNAPAAEEVADHWNNVHFDLPDRDQTAADDIIGASDPAYLRFLENLREDGNSYNIELPVSSGESLSFVYEKQDDSHGQCDATETRKNSVQRKNGEPEICLGKGCNETRDQCDAGKARQTSSQSKNGESEICLGKDCNETQGHCQIRDEAGTECDLRVPSGSNKSSLTGRKFSYKTKNGLRSGFRREGKSQMEELLKRESKKKVDERCDPTVASGRDRRSCSPMKPRIEDETGDAPESACKVEAPMPAKTGDTRTGKVMAPSLVRDRATKTIPCRSELKMKSQKDVSDMQNRKRRRLISEETQRKESLNPVLCEEPAKTKTPSNKNLQCRPKVELDDMQDRKRRHFISEETQRKESMNPVPCEEPSATKKPSNKNQQCRPKVERDDMKDRKRRRLISEETQRKESLNPVSREEPATTKMPSNKNQKCRPELDGDQIDKCYEIFLRSLKKKPTNVEFVPSVGEKVLYHDYPLSCPTSPSDSDILEIDAATFANDVNTPFVPAKNHEVIDLDLEPEEGHGGNHYNSVFRVKLLENLRKPYDQREYNELLKEVSCRKQLVKDRELRHGRTVKIKLKAVGQSYLDKYTDFARKLQEIKPDSECNHPVMLNLLRGFVYWLENLPLHGSFKPWLDEACLKVLPSCKRVPCD